MSKPSCTTIYNDFAGKSTSRAAGEGVAQGLTGMLGLGGFWHPVDDSVTSTVQNTFSQLKSKWQQIINDEKGQINAEQKQFAQDQLNMISSTMQYNDEVLSERIDKNSLYIAILFVALIIVIIYLVVI